MDQFTNCVVRRQELRSAPSTLLFRFSPRPVHTHRKVSTVSVYSQRKRWPVTEVRHHGLSWAGDCTAAATASCTPIYLLVPCALRDLPSVFKLALQPGSKKDRAAQPLELTAVTRHCHMLPSWMSRQGGSGRPNLCGSMDSR